MKCKWCGKTCMSLDECNFCWEVTRRIDTFLQSKIAREFVQSILNKYRYTFPDEVKE